MKRPRPWSHNHHRGDGIGRFVEILEAILSQPSEFTTRGLAEKLSMNPKTLQHHLNSLEASGLVEFRAGERLHTSRPGPPPRLYRRTARLVKQA